MTIDDMTRTSLRTAEAGAVAPENLVDRLEALAARRGWLDRTAFVQDETSYTYRRLYDQIRRAAGGLRAVGVRPGARVLLAVPDSFEFVVTFLAIVRSGAVAVPVNTYFHADELRGCEEIAEPSLVVADPALRGAFAADAVTPSGLMESAAEPPAEPVPAGAPAFAVFTSGTTGSPRLCFHAHGDAEYFDRSIGHLLDLREDDVCYSVSRMYFAYGLGNSVLLPLQRGAATVLSRERADEDSALEIIRRHRVRIFYGQPSFYARLLAHPNSSELDRLRLAMVAGEVLPRPVEDRLRTLLGNRLLNICGTSEIGHAVLVNGPDEIRDYTVGRIVPPFRMRIVDESGAPVPAGSTGRLQIAGPTIGPGVARGSLDPHRLAADEWFETGDSASADTDGFVTLHGRLDDIEIVAGANVHPVEVEDTLAGVEGVAEVAVCAVRRANGVSSLRAYVVPAPGTAAGDLLAERLIATARESLTWYKVPEDVRFLDTMPRNSTGKILRRALRQKALEDADANH